MHFTAILTSTISPTSGARAYKLRITVGPAGNTVYIDEKICFQTAKINISLPQHFPSPHETAKSIYIIILFFSLLV